MNLTSSKFNLLLGVVIVAASQVPVLAQEIVPFSLSSQSARLNQDFHAQRRSELKTPLSSAVSPRTVVFIGDRVIPQFVDGGAWQTSVTVVNLENHPTAFDVLFFKDDGTDLIVPVVGQGPVRAMHISLVTAGSLTFETAGTANDLAQGWALLSQANNDSVGVFAVFRQTIPGQQAQEAVVPAVNQFENHFVLPYDNTKYVTGIALANPTLNRVVIPLNIRNETGQIIDTRQLTLGPYSHTALSVPDSWPTSAGKRGIIEFVTTGFGVGALGLRFNGAAFTSLNVLQNFAWTQ
jgi:hypothetical protein